MGDVISLSERRRARGAGAAGRTGMPRGARATFFFDLALPETYLAAERVDRSFGGVRWQPACLESLHRGDPLLDPSARAHAVAVVEERAAALGIPLVWPDPFPADVRPAMRVAALACERGQGASFVLAAGRLAFCGGFDLRAPEVLAEAAAAAAIPLEDCLAAAGDPTRDVGAQEAGRRLLAGGADRLPAVRVGRLLFCGEARLAEALLAAHAGDGRRLRPAAG